MTKIRAVRARSISVPLDVATSLSSRRVVERHYGVVEVEGDDDHEGIGFCYVGGVVTLGVFTCQGRRPGPQRITCFQRLSGLAGRGSGP